MESHEVLKNSFENTSPKAVAAELGVSLSLVYKWAQEQSETGSGSRNPARSSARNHPPYRRCLRIVEWLCHKCDGYFVRNPDSSCNEGFEVLPATSEILDQFSKLLHRISESALDHSIDQDEAASIRRSWTSSSATPRDSCAAAKKAISKPSRRPSTATKGRRRERPSTESPSVPAQRNLALPSSVSSLPGRIGLPQLDETRPHFQRRKGPTGYSAGSPRSRFEEDGMFIHPRPVLFEFQSRVA